jgi:predicted dithiol-disulfide oxidoreductase (DUF899 family)
LIAGADFEGVAMSLPQVVSRDEWLVARRALLAREKELTRVRDALSADRRRLPMVRVEKDYRFEGPEGEVGLVELFEGRRQLIIQHFMFHPDWEDGCPSCTAASDENSAGLREHLAARDTSFAAVARAPLAKIEAYRLSRGWTFPFYSAYASDFNYDFHVSFDESRAAIEYNYRSKAELEQAGMDWVTDGLEMPGWSCFLRDGDDVFHTYSTFARGAEALGGSYYFLDMTALGRQEEWEEPKDRGGDGRPAIPDFST